MKVTIAFTSTEERESGLVAAFVKGLFPGAKVSQKDRQDGTKHTYITTHRKGKS